MTKKGFAPKIWGLFVAVTTLADWILSDSIRRGPLSSGELLTLELFGESPRRVMPAPELAGEWWLVLYYGIVMYFIGFMLAYLSDYEDLKILWRKVSNNTIMTLFGSLFLLCMGAFGYGFFVNTYMLPTIMRFYLAITAAFIPCSIILHLFALHYYVLPHLKLTKS